MDFRALADWVLLQSPSALPFRLLTEGEGIVYRDSLEEVLTIVVSQMIEGRTVVVIPPGVD